MHNLVIRIKMIKNGRSGENVKMVVLPKRQSVKMVVLPKRQNVKLSFSQNAKM
jgi:hypothetical protein